MATHTLVAAAWAKGKYDVYRLSRDGSLSGYMHPPGLAYLVNLDVNAHMDIDQVFLSAWNQQAKGSFIFYVVFILLLSLNWSSTALVTLPSPPSSLSLPLILSLC